jgi:hypothetical protein
MPCAVPGTVRPGQPKTGMRLGRAAGESHWPLHGAQTCTATATSHRQASCGLPGGRDVSDTAAGSPTPSVGPARGTIEDDPSAAPGPASVRLAACRPQRRSAAARPASRGRGRTAGAHRPATALMPGVDQCRWACTRQRPRPGPAHRGPGRYPRLGYPAAGRLRPRASVTVPPAMFGYAAVDADGAHRKCPVLLGESAQPGPCLRVPVRGLVGQGVGMVGLWCLGFV